MRFLIVDHYYQKFLKDLYIDQPDLARLSYSEQYEYLMGKSFGISNFYSLNLSKLGHEAAEIIFNCEPLQLQWAGEHTLSVSPNRLRLSFSRWHGIPLLRPRRDRRWLSEILLAQIKTYKPDVLYLQDIGKLPVELLREARNYVRLIVAQHASKIDPIWPLEEYDLVLSSIPEMVDYIRGKGKKSESFRLGFGERILERLGELNQEYEVVFVGSYGAETSPHAEGTRLLEHLAGKRQVDFWGPGIERLSSNSTVRQRFHGEAWGLDAYRVYGASKIALNRHAEWANESANNCRLFEVTGIGTMLLTDYKKNLGELFEIGKEVVAYHSIEECIEMIDYYLLHNDERQSIARAGQRRTLKEHTYSHRMEELTDILKRFIS